MEKMLIRGGLGDVYKRQFTDLLFSNDNLALMNHHP